MVSDVLSAICNLADFKNNDLSIYPTKALISINRVGDPLEYYIKDAFANSFRLNQDKKGEAYSKILSWEGRQNNPPDLMLKNGDAFEIKKIGSGDGTNGIALNSSPPKNRLYPDDTRILEACRKELNGKPTDIFYIIGHASNKHKRIKYLFFVQGLCYAANKEVYESISNPIGKAVKDLITSTGYKGGITKELGRINSVDPLGITYFRIRGMWGIENPIKVYSSICKYDPKKEFSLFALMTKGKFDSFPAESRKRLEKHKRISISDVKIKDPNNPAKLLDAKLIKGEIL